eukprot:COSAG01_NODE_1467_length_10217_cov_33.824570_12_plen_77_part_00
MIDWHLCVVQAARRIEICRQGWAAALTVPPEQAVRWSTAAPDTVMMSTRGAECKGGPAVVVLVRLLLFHDKNRSSD